MRRRLRLGAPPPPGEFQGASARRLEGVLPHHASRSSTPTPTPPRTSTGRNSRRSPSTARPAFRRKNPRGPRRRRPDPRRGSQCPRCRAGLTRMAPCLLRRGGRPHATAQQRRRGCGRRRTQPVRLRHARPGRTAFLATLQSEPTGSDRALDMRALNAGSEEHTFNVLNLAPWNLDIWRAEDYRAAQATPDGRLPRLPEPRASDRATTQAARSCRKLFLYDRLHRHSRPRLDRRGRRRR